MEDVRDALMIGRDSQGQVVRRPLSPHLQVYRPQITTVLSILNRITGVALGAGTVLMTWWMVAAATSPHAWNIVRAFTLSPVGLIMLLGWTVCLAYHTLGSLRHLAWDVGIGFDLRTTHLSGWAAVAGTVLLTAIVWGVALIGWQ